MKRRKENIRKKTVSRNKRSVLPILILCASFLEVLRSSCLASSRSNDFESIVQSYPSSAPSWVIPGSMEPRVRKWNEGLRACQEAYAKAHVQCFPLFRQTESNRMMIEKKLQALLMKGFQIQMNQLKDALSSAVSQTHADVIVFEQKVNWKTSLTRFRQNLPILEQVAHFDLERHCILTELEQGRGDVRKAKFLLYRKGWYAESQAPVKPLLEALEDIFQGGEGTIGLLPNRQFYLKDKGIVLPSDPLAPWKTLCEALYVYATEMENTQVPKQVETDFEAGSWALARTLGKGRATFLAWKDREIERVYQHSHLPSGDCTAAKPPFHTGIPDLDSTEPWCQWPQARSGLINRFRDMDHNFSRLQTNCMLISESWTNIQALIPLEATLKKFQPIEVTDILDTWVQAAVIAAVEQVPEGPFRPSQEIPYQQRLLWCRRYCDFMASALILSEEKLSGDSGFMSSQQRAHWRSQLQNWSAQQHLNEYAKLQEWAQLAAYSFWWPLEQAATQFSGRAFGDLSPDENWELVQKFHQIITNKQGKVALKHEDIAWQTVHELCPYRLTAAFQGKGFARERWVAWASILALAAAKTHDALISKHSHARNKAKYYYDQVRAYAQHYPSTEAVITENAQIAQKALERLYTI